MFSWFRISECDPGNRPKFGRDLYDLKVSAESVLVFLPVTAVRASQSVHAHMSKNGMRHPRLVEY